MDEIVSSQDNSTSASSQACSDASSPPPSTREKVSVHKIEKTVTKAMKRDSVSQACSIKGYPDASSSLASEAGKVSTSKAKKRVTKTRSWKKPKGKPKRPLSAYNIFFACERQSIILSTPDPPPNSYSLKRRRRRGRHCHGKISFQDLAKQIASKWNSLDSTARNEFENLAAQDRRRYTMELETWQRQKQTEAFGDSFCHPQTTPHTSQIERPSSSMNYVGTVSDVVAAVDEAAGKQLFEKGPCASIISKDVNGYAVVTAPINSQTAKQSSCGSDSRIIATTEKQLCDKEILCASNTMKLLKDADANTMFTPRNISRIANPSSLMNDGVAIFNVVASAQEQLREEKQSASSSMQYSTEAAANAVVTHPINDLIATESSSTNDTVNVFNLAAAAEEAAEKQLYAKELNAWNSIKSSKEADAKAVVDCFTNRESRIFKVPSSSGSRTNEVTRFLAPAERQQYELERDAWNSIKNSKETDASSVVNCFKTHMH